MSIDYIPKMCFLCREKYPSTFLLDMSIHCYSFLLYLNLIHLKFILEFTIDPVLFIENIGFFCTDLYK